MKRCFILISFILCLFLTHAATLPENEAVADRIKDVLLESYDNYEGFNFKERLVLKFGKRTFIDCVTLWRENYTNIEKFIWEC